jgi:hypothetical protein
MASTRRKAPDPRRKKAARGTRRRGGNERTLTLPELFQRYFDRQLRTTRAGASAKLGETGLGGSVVFDPRQLCCRRIAELLGSGGPFGPGLEDIANQHFGATPAQATALGAWPNHQLWLFLETLRLGLRCPHGPHGGPPDLPRLPDPAPDPGPDPGPYRMHFRGRVSRGGRRLEVHLSGKNQIEITFVAPRIP